MKDIPESDFSLDEFKDEINKQSTKLKKQKHEKAESKLQIIESYLNEKYEMRFNTILSLPEHKLKGDNSPFTVMNESSIYRELEHNSYRCSPAIIKTLLKSNFLAEFNPITEYFNSLPNYDPNKEPDYITQTGQYIKVNPEDQERFNLQFRKFLVRCVACSLLGVVNKQAFVIISPKQNGGKSTFCRWLCPPALNSYMQENISTDKDSQIALTENFIINMDELATLDKAGMEGLKSFMSKDSVKTRKPYDAKALPYRRISNFVGSTNNIEFLTDVTGSVRWLCFEIISIDFDYSKKILIDKLWAQALYLLKSGFKYQLTTEEILQNEKANARHRQITNEEDCIQRKYNLGTNQQYTAFLSATEILEKLRGDFPYLAKDLHVQRVGKAMQALGFIQESKRDEKGSRKGYYVSEI